MDVMRLLKLLKRDCEVLLYRSSAGHTGFHRGGSEYEEAKTLIKYIVKNLLSKTVVVMGDLWIQVIEIIIFLEERCEAMKLIFLCQLLIRSAKTRLRKFYEEKNIGVKPSTIFRYINSICFQECTPSFIARYINT